MPFHAFVHVVFTTTLRQILQTTLYGQPSTQQENSMLDLIVPTWKYCFFTGKSHLDQLVAFGSKVGC